MGVGTHAHTHIRTKTGAHTCVHTRTHAYTYMSVRACAHTRARAAYLSLIVGLKCKASGAPSAHPAGPAAIPGSGPRPACATFPRCPLLPYTEPLPATYVYEPPLLLTSSHFGAQAPREA